MLEVRSDFSSLECRPLLMPRLLKLSAFSIHRATTMLVADFGNRSRPHSDMAIVDYDFCNGEAR